VFKKQYLHHGRLKGVPTSIAAKSSAWYQSIENQMYFTESAVTFNVVGSENDDMISFYVYNRKHEPIKCIGGDGYGLPVGYTCDVAIGDDREFITFTIDKEKK
jgi:hypothetical protein